MNDALSPYSAVLLASYGGPRRPEDVLPFMRNATAGRGVPDERLLEVSQHYQLFGGRSPINEQNEALRDALAAELRKRGCPRPVVIGNRNWTPFFAETVSALHRDRHDRVVALTTAAYSCYSACRQYREDLAAVMERVPGITIEKAGPYAERDGCASTTSPDQQRGDEGVVRHTLHSDRHERSLRERHPRCPLRRPTHQGCLSGGRGRRGPPG